MTVGTGLERSHQDAKAAGSPGTSTRNVNIAPPAGKARRLSWKEQRELEQLPAQIETLESDKAALEAEVADPAFYARPHGEVSAALARLAELGAAVEAAYARWSELDAR